MSPRSRGRKPKKSGKSKRTNKRQAPTSGRATAAGPGYSGLRIELPRSPLDDVLTRHVRPDQFGSSHRRALTASAALPGAGGPRVLEQATAELVGAELRNPEVQGLRFDLWAHDLIESARNRVLSDVAWNNGTWQGPWWLLHGLASIGSYGLGGYAAQQVAESAKALPRAALAQQPDWLALMPDIEATGDVHVLRDVYGTQFGVIAGFAYPGGIDPSVYLLGFDASEYLSLAAAGVFGDAESAVAAWREQVGDAAPGVEPVTPQVLAWLSHAEHSEGLIGEREQGALLDDYFRGPAASRTSPGSSVGGTRNCRTVTQWPCRRRSQPGIPRGTVTFLTRTRSRRWPGSGWASCCQAPSTQSRLGDRRPSVIRSPAGGTMRTRPEPCSCCRSGSAGTASRRACRRT